MGAICQTPSRDTTTTLVANTKLRVLIHDREEGKICQQENMALNRIIVQQEFQKLTRDSLLTVMGRLDSVRQHQLSVRDGLLNLSMQQNKLTGQQLSLSQKNLRRQKVKTFTVAGIGITVSVFLAYLLLK